MNDSPIIFILDEMGHDFIHETFALMVMADSQAAQSIAKAAARGNGMIIFIVHDTSIIHMGIKADSFLLQQGLDICQGTGIAGIDGADLIVGHNFSLFHDHKFIVAGAKADFSACSNVVFQSTRGLLSRK